MRHICSKNWELWVAGKKDEAISTITNILETGLITSTTIIGEVSIAAFAGVPGLTVGTTLSETSLLFSIVTAITQKSFKYFLQNKTNRIQWSCLPKAS